MAKFTLKVTGNKAVAKMLEDFGKEGREIVEDEIVSTAHEMSSKAVNQAPSDTGTLRNSAYVEFDKQAILAEVGFNSSYAAFMEFGTKSKVQVPAGWEDIASEFRNQKFNNLVDFEEAITAWVRRNGIEESAVYPIMMKILRIGVEPQPFLYPAFISSTKDLMNNINKGLNGLSKKY